MTKRHMGGQRTGENELLPLTESLHDTLVRAIPCWEQSIAPALRLGKNVLVVTHGNVVRLVLSCAPSCLFCLSLFCMQAFASFRLFQAHSMGAWGLGFGVSGFGDGAEGWGNRVWCFGLMYSLRRCAVRCRAHGLVDVRHATFGCLPGIPTPLPRTLQPHKINQHKPRP